MLLSEIKTEKNLINFFYILLLFIFNFLHLLFSFFSFLFIILLDISPVNNLLFKDILIQLSTFRINNTFFILISIIYTYL